MQWFAIRTFKNKQKITNETHQETKRTNKTIRKSIPKLMELSEGL